VVSCIHRQTFLADQLLALPCISVSLKLQKAGKIIHQSFCDSESRTQLERCKQEKMTAMKIWFLPPATPFKTSVRIILGACVVLTALAMMVGAWTLPFVFESSTIFYKFGLDRILLQTGKLLGLTATVLLLLQLVMVSRFRFLDKIFSLNRLYALHRFNGFAIVTLMLLHGLLILAAEDFTFFPMEKRYWPEFLGIGTALVMIGIVLFANWRQVMGLTYELWRRTHQALASLVILSVFVHLLFVSETFESGLPRSLALLFTALNLILIARLWFRRFFQRRRLHQVTRIAPAGQNAYALTLAPINGSTPVTHLPGQFAFIRPLSAKVPREEHPFTIASSPTASKHLQFFIGDRGDWTKLIGRLAIGDAVVVDGPFGMFTHTVLAQEGPVIMIAGGIGITPMLSMLRYMADTGDKRSLLLIWSLRSPGSGIINDELRSLSKRLLDLRVEMFFTRTDGSGPKKSRLERNSLSRILKGWPRSAHVFVCGPPAMMESVAEVLRTLGFSPSNIHKERFQF